METHRCVIPQFNMYIASMEKMEVSWLYPPGVAQKNNMKAFAKKTEKLKMTNK